VKINLAARVSIALGLQALVGLPTYALQRVDVSDGRSHVVKISAKEMTRLSVKDSKIKRLDFLDGELEVQKNADLGDYLILPTSTSKPINVFVTTSTGRTHALILQPTDMPLETVVLLEPARDDSEARAPSQRNDRAAGLEVAVKRFVNAMARGEKLPEADVTKMSQEIALWKEAKFVLTERHSARNLVGEHYKLTNVSGLQMVLAEQELYRQGVVAVAIERLVLADGETTDIFIVRVNNDG